MSRIEETPGMNKDGISTLFSEQEVKALFKKYLILMGGVEVLIFLMCWLYQLGIKEFDRYGNVDIPFPWRVYFLLAFVAPVVITFLLGLIIVAFNKFVYGIGHGERKRGGKGADQAGDAGRFQTFMDSMLQIPFLFTLIILCAGAGIVYRVDDIAGFAGRLGQESIRIVLLAVAVILVGGFMLGVLWLSLNYRVKKKEMEYQYKREVMDRLGIAFTENNKAIAADDRKINLVGDNVNLLSGSPEEIEKKRSLDL